MAPPPGRRRISVEVKEALEGKRHQRLEGGWVLERPFRASVRDSALPLDVVVDVEAVDGRLVASAMQLQRRRGAGSIDGTTLRAMPVEQYLAHVLREAMDFNPATGIPLVRPLVEATSSSVTTRLVGRTEDVERLLRGQGRRRAGREALEAVVAAYKAALADPKTHHRPTAAAAERLGYSHGHVSRVLTEARKAGLLGPARPGRPGERVQKVSRRKGDPR